MTKVEKNQIRKVQQLKELRNKKLMEYNQNVRRRDARLSEFQIKH